MTNEEKQKLLQIPEVVEEVKRHLWIESEKAGYDIGFQNAAEDWVNRFSKAWIEYHLPGGINGKNSGSNGKKISVSRIASAPRKRSAKSYR